MFVGGTAVGRMLVGIGVMVAVGTSVAVACIGAVGETLDLIAVGTTVGTIVTAGPPHPTSARSPSTAPHR